MFGPRKPIGQGDARGAPNPPVPRRGIGAFADTITPQEPSVSGSAELLGSLGGDPGIRLASAGAGAHGGARKWTSGIIAVQTFLRSQDGLGEANSEAQLAALPLTRNARTLNKRPHLTAADLAPNG